MEQIDCHHRKNVWEGELRSRVGKELDLDSEASAD